VRLAPQVAAACSLARVLVVFHHTWRSGDIYECQSSLGWLVVCRRHLMFDADKATCKRRCPAAATAAAAVVAG
jgi:hypothetical protein